MLQALTLVVMATVVSQAPVGKAVAPQPGAEVPEFSLKDVHRRTRNWGDFKNKKAVVVVFLDTECPLAKLYLPEVIELHKVYAGKGVQFLTVYPNEHDTFVAVSSHAQERSVPFPVLKDFGQQTATAFGVKRTPEAFLLDPGRVIRYQGRIDDQYGIGVRRAQPTRRDLKEALDELLADKAVSVAQTEAPGCLLERAPKNRIKEEVTYARDVAPLLQKRCQECHRPGEIGPFSLLTYEDARKRINRIREAVVEERMPPWHADPRFGKFKNDRRMSEAEKDILLAWIEQGCPKGDEKELPPALVFTDGWKIGKPDAVYRMPEEFNVPASGVLEYRRFTVDPGFKEDVWIQAAECRPGNRAVVHHVVVYILEKGRPVLALDGSIEMLSGWAPGDMPAIYAPGLARKIPAGSKLIFEMHYTPNGTAQSDRSSVGLIFAKKPPEHPVQTFILANNRFRIPPGASYHRGELTFTFKDDARVLSFMPHMHLRGVSAKYVVTYPNGSSETLLFVPDYDFNWQSVYRFAEPLKIPKGAKLTWTCWWDNSADNPRNPDPTKEVRLGPQTWDEMQNGWMELVWQKDPKTAEEASVMSAWKKAGAEVGWMSPATGFGGRLFYTDNQRKKGDLIAFRITNITPAALEGLPQPHFPFGLSLRSSKITDAGLKELGGMKELRALSLAETKITDAGLKELPRIMQLQALGLSGTQITDAGLKELTGMKQLRSLNLAGTKITDAGMKELGRMKQLQTLNLLYTAVTDAGLQELAGLKLKALWVPYGSQTNEGLKHYVAAVDPEVLHLNGWRKVTDAGLKEIAGLRRVQELYLSDTKVTDEGLQTLAGMKSLQTLDLSDTGTTDAGLKALTGLEQLQALNLQYTKTTDAGVKQLAGLKQLRSLDLQFTGVTDAGMKHIAGLKQLQALNLQFTKVTDSAMKDVAGMTQLHTLNLHSTPVSDAGLKALAGLKQLQTLNLYHCAITDAGLNDLAGMGQLRALDVSNTKISDAGVKKLAALKQLQSLHLRYTTITDAGLEELAAMKQLRAVDLHQTKVTRAGVAKLQKALPTCSISQ